MKNKKWKEFGKLAGKCYLAIGMGEQDHEIWNQAFAALKEVVTAERSDGPDNIAELYLLD